MAKHYIKAGKPRASKPKAEIRAAPTWFEKTHPVGSAERFLDDAARDALAMAAAGGLPTPKSVAADAIKATVRDALRKYPDPLLNEAAKLPRDELVRRAANAAAYQKAMEARNRAADLAAAAMSPFGNMAMTTAAANAAEDLGVQQDAGGGYTGGRNTVSRVEARNTTKRERERVATIEAALHEERRPKLEARVEPPGPQITPEQARELMSGRGGQGDPDAMLGERLNPLVTAAMMSFGIPMTAAQTLVASGMTTTMMAGLERIREDRPKTAGLLNLALTAASLPGMAAAARRSFVRAVNDALAEPTDAKLNLLYEMTKAAAERRQGRAPGAQEVQVSEGLQKLIASKTPPKQLDWQGPRKLLTLDAEGNKSLSRGSTSTSVQKPGPSTTAQKPGPVTSARKPGLSTATQKPRSPQHPFYALDDNAKEELLNQYIAALDDYEKWGAHYRGFGDLPRRSGTAPAVKKVISQGDQIPPEVRDFIDGQLANYNGNVHNFFRELTNDERFTGFWDWMGRGTRIPPPRESGFVWTVDRAGAQPVGESRWYADLVQRYGEERARAMAQFVSSQDYPDYFLPPGPDGQAALDEIRQYASAHKIIRDVTEPGEIVIGGSAGINLEGTISRGTAVPHDLDFAGYIANASRRTDIPFYLNDGKPLSPQVRNEMYAALSSHENIENAPIIQKLRRLYPELKDAGFRYARYDWEFNHDAQYKPGVFTIVKRPDITEKGNGTTLLTTRIDGNKVDIMLSDAKITPNPIDPKYGSADVAFDWKDYYGWRPKDLQDKADFSRFSQDNPIASAVSGRARFSPSRFADSLVTDEGFPVVVDIEQTPGGPTIPMVMNHRGVMLQADDPSLLLMYAKDNPVNSSRFASPAGASDKPLAAARVINRIARSQGAQGEAAPSIGVYRADDLQKLADHLIYWAGASDDIVVYRNGATVDPAANLANVLYTENAVTGGPFSFWPAKAGSNYRSSGHPRNQELITRALENPTPENLKALGQAFGESTRGSEPMVDRIDNRLRNVLYNRSTSHYAEAKPGRYVPDTETTGVFHASDPDLRDKLIKALSDSRFALPFLAAAGLAEGSTEPGDPQPASTNQDAKGGNAFDPAKDRLVVPEGREKEYEEYMDSLANLDTSTHKNYLVPKDWRTNTEYNKDYDYVAAFLADKAQPVQADDGYWHMSDVGKMPNHPTFSNESYYARDPKWAPYAGRWEGEKFIPPEVRQDSKGGDAGPGTAVSGTPVPKGPAPAPSGPRIVINPQVFDDKRDALCVAFNEAFRLVMEENAFEPVSEPTEKQRKFFADTAYAGDELQLRRTILARIATLDTSVSDPTDEQLEETAEMLEMVMEVGAPQNEWEQQAVQRLHDVVARAREAHTPEEPLPPQDEASTRADVGGGVAKEDWTDGDVRYIEQNGGYYKQTYRKGATEATSGWMGQVIQKDEWDAAQKSMQGGASANETAEAWDKGAEQRAAAREAEAKTRAAALEETNRINMLVAKGTLGYKTGRALLASAADAVSGSDAEAIANLGSKLDTVEQKAEELARIKSAGIDMSLAPAGLEAEDYKDMARGTVNAIVNAPIYVAEGIAQTGAAAVGAVTGVAKGVASGTGLVSGAWHGIGDAMGAIHAAGDSLRGAVNLDYKGARREMGDLPVAKGLPSLNQIESGVLTTIGGLATPGMLMKGMRSASVAPRAAQAVKPVAQTTKSSLSKFQAIQPIPVKQAAERAAQAVKPAAQTAKSSLSKFQALQPIPVKQTIRSAGMGAQPIKTASTVKPVQSVLAPSKAGLQSFVPKAVFGEARPGEIVFGKKPWGTIQQLAKERGITLPSTFKPSIGGATLQERVASVWADPARFNSANPAYVRSFGYISAPNRVIVKPGFQFRGTSRSTAGQFVGMSSRNGVGVHYTPEEFAGGRALELARGADHFGMFGQNGEFFPIW